MFIKVCYIEVFGVLKVVLSFLYIFVVLIGLYMNIIVIFDLLMYFVLGVIWMIIYVSLMFIVVKLIKVLLFYMVVGF